jgi:hypothetical protein
MQQTEDICKIRTAGFLRNISHTDFPQSDWRFCPLSNQWPALIDALRNRRFAGR